MKRFLYILLWILTVLNLAFCVYVTVLSVSALGESSQTGTAIAGVFGVIFFITSLASTALSTGLSFIVVKNRALRSVIFVNLAAVLLVAVNALILFGFVLPSTRSIG